MIKFLRSLLPAPAPQRPPADPVRALSRLRSIVSDAAIEDAWEELDRCADEVREQVREDVERGSLGAFPLHAATIWLGYEAANRGEALTPMLIERLRPSLVWAFGFEENHVLLGGALGTLDGLSLEAREQIALEAFDELGSESARRYWLLLKVRTDAFLEHTFKALHDFTAAGAPGAYREPPETPVDPGEEQPVIDPGPRAKMAGAFRQFGSEDVPTLLKHFSFENNGADILIEALAATGSSEVVSVLEQASKDERRRVKHAAALALHRLGAD